MTEITKLLNIKYPILQGAMAQISRYKLVSAVSNAGGLGILASGGMTAETVREEIIKCKELTNKPFAVNLMMMMDNINDIIDVLIETNVKIVTTGAGTPKPYMEKLKKENFTVIPVVPSVKIAKKMEALGVDAVIAEECPISDDYKKAVLNAQDNSTIVTGRTNNAPVRCLKNELTNKFLEMEYQNVGREELEKITLGSLSKAVYDGDVINGSVMAGQISGMITQIKTVNQIIVELISGLENVEQKTKKSVEEFYI